MSIPLSDSRTRTGQPPEDSSADSPVTPRERTDTTRSPRARKTRQHKPPQRHTTTRSPPAHRHHPESAPPRFPSPPSRPSRHHAHAIVVVCRFVFFLSLFSSFPLSLVPPLLLLHLPLCLPLSTYLPMVIDHHPLPYQSAKLRGGWSMTSPTTTQVIQG
jgi:hypothetical protein